MQSGTVLRAEDYRRRRDRLEGWDIGITSYKLGGRYCCEVDNVSSGGRLARGEGATREEAIRQGRCWRERGCTRRADNLRKNRRSATFNSGAAFCRWNQRKAAAPARARCARL